MNEKPMDCKVRELALRIFERAMFYNNTSTTQELTGNKPTFFVNFLGHTAGFELDIAVDGYTRSRKLERHVVYLTEGEYRPLEEILTELEYILHRMQAVYDDWYESERVNR